MNDYKDKLWFQYILYTHLDYVISLNTINRLRKGRIRNQNQNRRKELCYSGYQVNSIKPKNHVTQHNPQM